MFLAKIFVKFKKGVKNPEAQTLETLVQRLDIQEISDISCVKVYEFKINSTDVDEAQKIAKKMALEVLSNPIVEDFEVEICEQA